MSVWRSCYRKAPFVRSIYHFHSLVAVCRRVKRSFPLSWNRKLFLFLPRGLLQRGVAIMEYSSVYLVTVTRGKCKFSLRSSFFFLHPTSTMYPISGISDGTSSPCFDVSHFPLSLYPPKKERGDDKMCLNRRKDMNESHNSSKRVTQSYHVCQMKFWGAFPIFCLLSSVGGVCEWCHRWREKFKMEIFICWITEYSTKVFIGWMKGTYGGLGAENSMTSFTNIPILSYCCL